ncbi:probable 28S ribosomal protein S10, mitochondrial [Hyalella azteca]|uniref:Probable 28S ribosomal protein S10, mitochondrial n=1 Tax=Hyalella azteca TaxID=294128 RepID=A0A8B7NYZ5_HYAAZ|nr:probable 28S ribosomal protein S10, mitochondrial [Hyalella azteca]
MSLCCTKNFLNQEFRHLCRILWVNKPYYQRKMMHRMSNSYLSKEMKFCYLNQLNTSLLGKTLQHGFHSGSEPPYLISHEPKPYNYPLVNIQVKGYDHSVLQSYQSWVTRIAERLNLVVSNAWATPCKKLQITRFEPKSTKVEDTFKLNIYERTVQVSEMPSLVLPVLLEVLQAGLPEGVELYVDHHSEEAEKIRYVPNKELRELQQELKDVHNPPVAPRFRGKK